MARAIPPFAQQLRAREITMHASSLGQAATGLSTSAPDFTRQLRWRLLLVGAFLALDLVFLIAGGGVSSWPVIMAYIPYLLVIGTIRLQAARVARQALEMPLLVVAFAADFVFIAVQLHLSGGGWWHGASFYVLVIVMAASTVPPRALVAVTAFGVLVYVAKGWFEVTGILAPPVWGDFPRPIGNMSFLWNYAGFGALIMIGAATIQSRLVERIRQAQARYRTVVDASPYLVLTLDKDGVITTASRIAEHITGIPAGTLVGTPMHALLHPSERGALAESLARASSGERFRQEFRGVGDGGPEWYGMGLAEVVDNQTSDAVVAVIRNMTAERAHAEATARMQSELEESRRLELVGRLVSGVAHELNNPLSAILTLSEQLQNEDTVHGGDEMRVIHEQARRARSIVRDLLQVVRAKSPNARDVIDVRTAVQRALDGAATRPEAQSVGVTFVAPDSACLAELEEGAMEQVITNLVVNGMQAAPAGGMVSVKVQASESRVRVQVQDTGPGINEATRSRLFEPFFTTRAPGQGTGLGLAVSRAIVERNGGTLVAHASAPGKGATFVVQLPRVSSAPVAPGAAVAGDPVCAPVNAEQTSAPVFGAVATLASGGPLRHVMIVDDEASIRNALARWFTRTGWAVTLCEDGAQALQLVRKDREKFDVILCDLKMPGLSGMDVYRVLQSENPMLLERLIIATGDVASSDVAAFLSTVQVPVLEKPFALDQLATVLRQLESAQHVSD